MIIQTIASLKNISSPSSSDIYNVIGYYEPVDGGGGDFYWDSGSIEPDNGGTIIQPASGGTGRWKRLYDGAVNVKWFGAKGDGINDDSLQIQQVCDVLNNMGGGQIVIPKGRYLFNYPVFVKHNIEITGEGMVSHIVSTRGWRGRAAFLVGDCYEINRATSDVRRSQHDAVTGLENSTYTDIPLGVWLQPDGNTHVVEASNTIIRNLLIEFVYGADGWGGYAIQFAHASNCYAKDIWTINACQAIGIGSDIPPSTPGCVDCYAFNVKVISPDVTHTYYAVGFVANSHRCGIISAISNTAMTIGSDDGSLVATNFTKNCILRDIEGVVGNSSTSEGIFLNNTSGTQVTNCTIKNAKAAFSVSFTELSYIDSANPNFINNNIAKDCTDAIKILSHYNNFYNLRSINCTTDMNFVNVNAALNSFIGCSMAVIVSPSGESTNWPSIHNIISAY